MLPQCYPNYKTVHRRFQYWCRNEVLRDAMTDLANTLCDDSALDESGCYIDATFASAKGGGAEIGPTIPWSCVSTRKAGFRRRSARNRRCQWDWAMWKGLRMTITGTGPRPCLPTPGYRQRRSDRPMQTQTSTSGILVLSSPHRMQCA